MSPLPKENFERVVSESRPSMASGFLEEDSFGGELFFFHHGATVFSVALRPSQRLMWIMGALGGGLEWLRELKKFGLCNGYEWIGFKCRRDNASVQSLARYWKAQLMCATDSGDEFCAPLKGR